MEDWEYKVPVIIGARGYAGVVMPPKFDAVHALAELHADPNKRRPIGGLAVRATTARPLVVGRTDQGCWLVLHLATGEVLGVGTTREEAIQDAKAQDAARHVEDPDAAPAGRGLAALASPP